jgi:dihydrofolate reductase
MRKLVLSMFMSLDGYIEAPNHEMVAPPWSDDLSRHWIWENIGRTEIALYGRVCYEGMARYWTSPEADGTEAKRLAGLRKLVFSTTLESANWGNVAIVRDDVAGEIARLKAEPGKDLTMFGGAGLANSFIRLGLFDEYQLLVTPLLLGGGTPLFQGGYGRQNLKLVESRPFDSGCVKQTYAVVK